MLSPIHSRYGGQKLFPKRLTKQLFSKRKHMDSGMSPVSWLLFKSRIVKFVKFPISTGISPTSSFSPKDKFSKFVKFPISEGISPMRLLCPSCKYNRFIT